MGFAEPERLVVDVGDEVPDFPLVVSHLVRARDEVALVRRGDQWFEPDDLPSETER